jgi:hypothetical protein
MSLQSINTAVHVHVCFEFEKGVLKLFAILICLQSFPFRTIVYYRWIENPHTTINFLFPNASPLRKKITVFVGQRRVKSYLHSHGIGRHTRDELYSIASHDLKAVSALLDNTTFLMGEKPCLADTAAFGLLANFVWHDLESPHNYMIKTDFRNIETYCQRIKDQVWPDWDEEIAKRKAIMYTNK